MPFFVISTPWAEGLLIVNNQIRAFTPKIEFFFFPLKPLSRIIKVSFAEPSKSFAFAIDHHLPQAHLND